MIRFFKHFVLFVTICVFLSCKQTSRLSEIKAVNITIRDSLEVEAAIDSFITPYRKHLNKTLDSLICFNPTTLTKTDTPLNTAIGNWMADALIERTDPVFYKRTGEHIDFVLLNHGGIRAALNRGPVTARNAYEIMPFENSVSVLEISRDKMNELLNFLAVSQRAHPISKQLKLQITKDSLVKKVLMHGKPLDSFSTFKVATSDYLANLGDQMTFFSDPLQRTDINYLIRNILIDTFKDTDTIKASDDDRFTF